jgi:Mg-chelatase subunit ChlI
MKSHSRTHSEREAAQARDDIRRLQHVRFAEISAELDAIYDSRRLTEEDIDHMAELDTESRTYSRSLPPHE